MRTGNTVIVECGPDGAEMASRVLSRGGIVIFPTDTVYGIGCDPFDKTAVSRIYSVKGRDPAKPLPVLAHSADAASELAHFDARTKRIAGRMWPGQLTIVLPLREKRLEETLGIRDKIAVRVPDHGCAQQMLSRCRYVVGTSANVSGGGPATDPLECKESMTGYDLLLDGGKISGRGESTIIEFAGDKLEIHREGAIKKEEVLAAL